MNITTEYFKEVDSTNNYLASRRPVGEDEMIVAWTDYQKAGRGCGTNSWESEQGKNLTFSVLFRPCGVPAKDQFILSMVNALALKTALSQYIGEVSIKWPNDIYWNDRKLCGTLIEPTLQGSHIKDCIIGTGINVNQREFLSDAPNPVSMAQILGHDTDREAVLNDTVHCLVGYLEQVAGGHWDQLRNEYRASLYRRGGVHGFRHPDGRVEPFRYVDVSNDGHLLLQRSHNRELLAFAFKEIGFVI